MRKETNRQSGELQFDTIVEPKNKWFDLNLKELWKYKDLILLFVKRNFISQYKQTVLGPAWIFVEPLFTSIVFTLVMAFVFLHEKFTAKSIVGAVLITVGTLAMVL